MEIVYIIGPQNGPFKIGHTRDLPKRLSALQTGSHLPLQVHASVQSMDAQALERQAHDALKDRRIQGEWFDCDLEVACRTIGADAPKARIANEGINGEEFRDWLSQMAQPPMPLDVAECQFALGMTDTEFKAALRYGGSGVLALACKALYHRLEPWMSDER